MTAHGRFFFLLGVGIVTRGVLINGAGHLDKNQKVKRHPVLFSSTQLDFVSPFFFANNAGG